MLLDEMVYREIYDEEIYPLINNWVVIESQDNYILLAANSLTHSIKEIGILSDDTFVLSPMETFYEDNTLETLKGKYMFRVLFGIFSKNYPLERIVNIAKVYTRPPFVINMCQLEGSRKI